MVHKMSLAPSAFKAVAAGTKTVEMRLYDEKRSRLKVGNIIEFVGTDGGGVIKCEVLSLTRYKDFFEVYGMYDKVALGYGEGEEANAEDMYEFYSAEKIGAYGVLAIEIRLID
ncbi:MAG: ASCH domain-containing protein [Clostridiales bacterium]|nr:ASCH domain-containing protein [Clostridiales bacterium]